MHPIERLRYVARASGAPPLLLARETAGALMGFASEPHGLVTACRRMVERQPSSGAIVWLAARALCADDPRSELSLAVTEIELDQTPRALAYELPDEATVVVLGQPQRTAEALFTRGDISVRVVDVLGEGRDFAYELLESGVDVEEVRPEGVATAVVDADLLLIEASAAGTTMAMSVTGSHAAAAVAHHAGVPVWMVAGIGTFLPEKMWLGLAGRCDQRDDPWDRDDDEFPLDLVSDVVGPKGRVDLATALRSVDCPVAPELYRTS